MDRLKRLAVMTLGAAAGAAVANLVRRAAYRRTRGSLAGRVIVVSGGSRGLGFELARELARGGATVTISARDEATLLRAQRRLADEGLEVDAVTCDVRNAHDAESLVAHVDARSGRVDVVVNDAGAIEVGSVWDQSLDDFRESVDTHVYGPLHLMRAVLPSMRARRSGQIVNVSSIGGLVGVPHLAPYCAGKFGLVGLSQAYAAEVAHDGITVTTVCPGLMRTGSPDHAYFKGHTRAEYTWFAISDSRPLLSASAGAAARRIVRAIARRERFVTITPVARLAMLTNAIAPNTTTRLLALAARLLPPPAFEQHTRREGVQSHSPLAPSVLTALDRAAKVAENQS
jgi:NAD(P)-dependent dehydrogenase (short-subunit alcohol dehydrogenase family)